MTKAQEIALLDEFIAKLGKESYLGPWLAASRGEIVRDITSDIIPSPMLPGEAATRAKQIVKDAQDWERGFKEGVADRHALITKRHDEELRRSREETVTLLRGIADKLEGR